MGIKALCFLKAVVVMAVVYIKSISWFGGGSKMKLIP